MERNYDLFFEVLKRFQNADILDKVIVMKSWCICFYKEYFSNIKYSSSIRTRDSDFLVSNPKK